jgi:hypothetical protein
MGKVVLILAATAVGLGLLSLHLVNRLREGDATIAELKTQVESLQGQVAAIPRFAVAPVSPAPLGVTEIPPKETPKTAAAPSSTPQTTAAVTSMLPSPLSNEDRMRVMREHRERQRQLMQDPEYRDAMRTQSRSNLARQYPGVIQEMGLDPQQADDFFNMLADQQMRSSEQMGPLWDADAAEKSDPAALQDRHRKIQQAAAEMQRQNEAELASRFGQGKLQAWKEYQSTVGQRYQLENMRTTLAAQGLPLGDDVSKPMLKALAAAQKAEADEYAAAVSRSAAPTLALRSAAVAFDSGNNMDQQIEMTKKRNQRTLDAVSSYLTFEQRAALEKEQDAQLKVLEAQQRVMRANGAASGGRVYAEGAGQLIVVP